MSKRLTKTQRKKIHNIANKYFAVILVIVLLLALVLGIAYKLGWLDKYFKKKQDVLSTAGGYVTNVSSLEDLKINFLDVGQGDCIIVELPDGKNMIIDSGQFTDAKNAIEEFTTQNNIKIFDYLLLTHQDRDHVDNMDWILENYQVNYIFRPNNYSSHSNASSLPESFNKFTEGGYVSTSATYADFLVAAYNEKCTVEVFNKSSDFSNKFIYQNKEYSYKFDFLTPTNEREKIVYDNPNDYSPIMILEYANKKVMFTGDAEEVVLEEYINTYGSTINVDVLKLGHHGSTNATSMEFVEAVDPEYAIIQCGIDNSYGHPHAETLNTLMSYDSNIKIYRNDTNGNIEISISQNSLDFQLENEDCTNNLLDGESLASIIQINFGEYLLNRKFLV